MSAARQLESANVHAIVILSSSVQAGNIGIVDKVLTEWLLRCLGMSLHNFFYSLHNTFHVKTFIERVKKVPVICTSLHFAGGFLFSFVNGRTGINDRDYNGFDSNAGSSSFSMLK